MLISIVLSFVLWLLNR
ncbi:hypothetical protein NKJ94_37255 [Mesorhizobium sp. M0060]